jgi:26S proteasome regulatory subunit T5
MDIYEEIFEDNRDALPEEFESMTADDVLRRIRLLDNEIRVLKDESTRLSLEQSGLKEKV